jgi:site-specific DNA-methyltransferase (adenine-specific)
MAYELHHGDALTVLRTMPSESVQCIVTDPPYGITANKWDVMPDMAAWWQEAHRVCSGAIVMTASQPFTSFVVVSNAKNYKHEWIWRKNRGSNFANTVREPFKEHESVLVFAQGKWTYNEQRQERRGTGASRGGSKVTWKSKSTNYRAFEERAPVEITHDRVPSSVQDFNIEVGLHPTQKPVTLFRYLVQTYSNEGDTVLDCFMGSGTCGAACAELGRNFIGVELDEGYFNIARNRIESTQPALQAVPT